MTKIMKVVAVRQDDHVITVAAKVENNETYEILRFDLKILEELCSWINFRSALGKPVQLPQSFFDDRGVSQ